MRLASFIPARRGDTCTQDYPSLSGSADYEIVSEIPTQVLLTSECRVPFAALGMMRCHTDGPVERDSKYRSKDAHGWLSHITVR